MIRQFPLVLLSALLTTPALAEDFNVFAAASLADALGEAAEVYEGATGDHATLVFAGSSALARQIQAGAPADLFISANQSWMDALEGDSLIVADSRLDLLGNALVLIGHGEAAVMPDPAALPGALGEGRLAMALIEAVPAGIYGKTAFESLGLWSAVEGQVAQADNVRAALALVATGEAPFGVVYATDAAADTGVSVVYTFPEGSHPPITYPAAVTSEASQPEAAGAFLDWLQSDEARAIFTRHGFTQPGE
ncbi:molybdate ABC transporter substrate-binding protein [Pararhodobacter sp. CCB-MM2]|uniref:molybdate ABC transporter substrate-binding protein n=1 Tax=Pararhodobacter sp. CCB-MM2 TaxID=1786003 RepID=UPI00082AF804|nr:molybdate ABC transporter substrate-binding protein [Pararhodobacter sp. CCB-MM2]